MRRALDLFCGAGGATKGLQQAGFEVHGVDIKPQPRYCGERFIQADALEFPLDGYDFIWASPPCQAFTKLRWMPTAREHPNLIPAVRARLVTSGIHYAIENVEDAPLGDSGFLIMLCGTMFGLGTPDGRAELRRHRLFETSFSIPLRPACQHGNASLSKVLTVTGHSPVDNTGRQSISVCGSGLPKGSKFERDTILVAGGRAMGGHLNRRGVISVVGKGGHLGALRRAITVTGSTPQTNTDRNRTRETFSVEDARAAMGIDWMPMRSLSQAIPPAYAEFIGRQVLETI